MHQPRFRLGLRTIKTALSVMLSLYLTSLFGSLSIFPALAAIGVMSRTFDEGLLECRNQAVGITIGGLFGCFAALALPEPPIWAIALGVMVIIFICASFHVGYSTSLSCAIFIVACMSDPDEVVRSVLIRLFHTAIGLSTGLLVNYLVLPYNNSAKICQLLAQILDTIPGSLSAIFEQQERPDTAFMDTLMEQLQYELSIYRHQRFRNKWLHQEEFTFFTGCAQTAQRLHQELIVLCRMAAIAPPDEENRTRLMCLGLQISGDSSDASQEETIVTNYHLRHLMEYHTQLTRLLETKAHHP